MSIKTEAILTTIDAVSDVTSIVSNIHDLNLFNKDNKELQIFAKHVHSKWEDGNFCSYEKSSIDGKLYLDVPLWLDVTNDGEKDKFLKNVNIHAYKKGNEVASFKQVQYITAKRTNCPEKKIILGDNESYNLHIAPHEAKRFNLEFFLSERDYDGEFDELRLEYYDKKMKKHSSHLLTIDKNWIEGRVEIPEEWININ